MIDIYSFMYKQIGNKVAYYRKMRNLTQDELADRVNISVSSISKLERGKYNNNIPLSMLIMIAEGLRIDVSMLVSFDEREKLLEFDQIKRGCDKMRNHFVHSSFFVSILIFSQDKSEKRVYAPFPHKNCNFSAYAAFLIRNVLL